MKSRAGKAFRLTRQKDIERVFARGRRAADRLIKLYVLEDRTSVEPAERIRLGVAVSKRHGRAVRRNRIKRLCREAFRLIRAELPAGRDYIIVPRLGVDLTLGELQASLKALAAKLLKPQNHKDKHR